MQTYGPLEAEWDSQELATQMLRKFQAFANKVIAPVIHLKKGSYAKFNDFINLPVGFTYILGE